MCSNPLLCARSELRNGEGGGELGPDANLQQTVEPNGPHAMDGR